MRGLKIYAREASKVPFVVSSTKSMDGGSGFQSARDEMRYFCTNAGAAALLFCACRALSVCVSVCMFMYCVSVRLITKCSSLVCQRATAAYQVVQSPACIYATHSVTWRLANCDRLRNSAALISALKQSQLWK